VRGGGEKGRRIIENKSEEGSVCMLTQCRNIKCVRWTKSPPCSPIYDTLKPKPYRRPANSPNSKLQHRGFRRQGWTYRRVLGKWELRGGLDSLMNDLVDMGGRGETEVCV